MSIITTAVELCNIALGKFGGAGDQVNATGQISSLSDTDPVSVWCNSHLPVYRQAAILDMASVSAPFRETLKFANLGDDLKQQDVVVASISGDGALVTVVTKEVHGRTTGDKVFLDYLQDTGYNNGVEQFNGTTQTVTVVDTLTYTFASAIQGTHKANTGISSIVPSVGPWYYAYNLPSDMMPGGMIGQIDEITMLQRNNLTSDYRYGVMMNLAGDGWLLLTDHVSSQDGLSAYIAYVTDSVAYSMWTSQMVETVATLLAAELCPVVGRSMADRQKILAEYDSFTKQNAKVFSAMMSNNTAMKVRDFSGGRVEGSRQNGFYQFDENRRRNWV
jgi:hypothetical protein